MNVELLEQPSTELTVQARAAIALASDKTRQDMMAMATKYTGITEIKNKAGRDECHSAAMALASARIAISKTGKAARDDATKFSKAVIDEEKSLIAITEPEEKRLLALRDAWDEVVAAEKAAKEAAERTRITAIHKRIAAIREFVALAAGCRTAARVDDLLTKLSLTSLAGFEEFADEAAAAHLEAMERVTAILAEKTELEAEQARIKAEQAAAAEKLAAERAEFEAQQAAAKLKAEQDAAAAKAEADRAEAERQAKAAAEAAEQARQRAAAQAELDRQRAELEAASAVAAAAAESQRAALAAERAEFEARVKAEQEAKEKAEKEALALAEQAQAATQTIAPETIEQIEAAVAIVDANRPPAPTEHGPAATETVATDPREETAMWNAITAKEPTDGDLMWLCIRAVATEYSWTTEQATTRLAAIQWTL